MQAKQAALAATAARQAEPASPGRLLGGGPADAQQQGAPISPAVAVELSDGETSSQGMEPGASLEPAVQTVCCDLPEQHVRLLQLLRLDHDSALQNVKGVAAKVSCRYPSPSARLAESSAGQSTWALSAELQSLQHHSVESLST